MATTSMSDTEPARPRVHRSARRDVAHASSPIHVTIPDLASVAWISHISLKGDFDLAPASRAAHALARGCVSGAWGLRDVRDDCDARVSAHTVIQLGHDPRPCLVCCQCHL